MVVAQRGMVIQSTPDNSNPHLLEPRANSNQNQFPLDFRHTFTVKLFYPQ